jgi:hypothetical protein
MKNRRKEKLSVSIYPAYTPSYYEWCKEYKVSSAYVSYKFYDMYNHINKDNNLITKYFKSKNYE